MKNYYTFIQWFSGIFLFLIIVNWQGKTAIELHKYGHMQDSVIKAKDSINNNKKHTKWQTQSQKQLR